MMSINHSSLQEGPFDLKTGLEPLSDPKDLFEIDKHYMEEMEERRQLLERMRTEVFASTSEVSVEGSKKLQHQIC